MNNPPVIKYIRDGKRSKIGVFVAFKEEDKVAIGYSLLHPSDAALTQAYNFQVKQVNGESYRLKRVNGIETPIEPYRSLFDKQVAIELAMKRAVTEVRFNKLPRKIQKQFRGFVALVERALKTTPVVI